MKKNPDITNQKPPIVFPYGGAKVGENSEKKLWNLERIMPLRTIEDICCYLSET